MIKMRAIGQQCSYFAFSGGELLLASLGSETLFYVHGALGRIAGLVDGATGAWAEDKGYIIW